MREKIIKIVKGKVFLGTLLFALLVAAVTAVSSTVLRENEKQEKQQLSLGESADNDVSQIAQATEPETLDVVVENLVKAETSPKDVTKETETEPVVETTEAQVAKADSGKVAASLPTLNFTLDSKMDWPIRGNVVLDYNMESTIYFPTLEQYKCNPAVLIQGEVSAPVTASIAGQVTEIGVNEEIGNYVVMDLGNSFLATYGQLKDITVLKGDYVTEGKVLGYIQEPTKYYVVEGSHLYFKITQDGKPIDPMDVIQ